MAAPPNANPDTPPSTKAGPQPHKNGADRPTNGRNGTGHNSGEHEWSEAEVEAVEAGHASIVPTIPIEKTTFAQQIGAIVDSARHTAIEKLVMVKTRLHTNHRSLDGAHPSLAAYARAASTKDPHHRPLKAALNKLVDVDKLLTRDRSELRSGKAPLYGFNKDRFARLITDHLNRRLSKGDQPPTSDVGGTSNVGGTSEVGGQGYEPPTSHVGGPDQPPTPDAANPPHLVQQPPTSDAPLTSLNGKENKKGEGSTGADAPTPFVNGVDATVPAADALPRQPSSTSTPKPTSKGRSPKATAAAEEDPEVIAALAAYNALTIPRRGATMDRDLALSIRKRLDAIGGLARWQVAMSAADARLDPWIAGDVPPDPGSGNKQFVVHLEYMLSMRDQRGNPRNVLRKLIDLANDAATKPGAKPTPALDPATMSDAAWKPRIQAFFETGAWEAWLGSKPREEGCLAPERLVRHFEALTGASQ